MKEWVVNPIEMPDPDAALEDVLPEGGVTGGDCWRLVGETVYRVFSIRPTTGTEPIGSFVQTLQPPYTEWENHPISTEDWVEGESCRP